MSLILLKKTLDGRFSGHKNFTTIFRILLQKKFLFFHFRVYVFFEDKFIFLCRIY